MDAFIDKMFSNGFTERLNNKINVIKSEKFRYRNFEFFRLRIIYILNGKMSEISKKGRNKKIEKKYISDPKTKDEKLVSKTPIFHSVYLENFNFRVLNRGDLLLWLISSWIS